MLVRTMPVSLLEEISRPVLTYEEEDGVIVRVCAEEIEAVVPEEEGTGIVECGSVGVKSNGMLFG